MSETATVEERLEAVEAQVRRIDELMVEIRQLAEQRIEPIELTVGRLQTTLALMGHLADQYVGGSKP